MPSSNTVWRDYETDGVPASGPHKVIKSEVRAWANSFTTSASILELGPYNWTGSNTDPAATDATPGLNAMIAAAQSNGFCDWFFPPGQYIFKTVPNWVENVPFFRVRGVSEYASVLYKSFPSTTGTNEGVFRVRTNGVDISDMTIVGMAPSQVAGLGTGCHICYAATAAAPTGYGRIERLNLTSGAPAGQAYIFTNVYFDGSLHTGGIRALAMNDVKLFGAETASMILTNTVSLTAKGPGTFSAGGKTGRIFINGSSGHMSSYINIDFATIIDGVQTLWTQGALIKAGIFIGGQIGHDAVNSAGVITMGVLQSCTLGTMGVNCFHTGGEIDGGTPPTFVKGAAVPVDSGSNAVGYWRKYGDKTIEQSFFASTLLASVPKTFAFPIPFPVGTFSSIVATPAGGLGCTLSITAQTVNDVTIVASVNTNAWVSVRGQ